ncbi:MAG: hypothetical protein QXM92_01880 [Candidatus Anstonellales archaeon]
MTILIPTTLGNYTNRYIRFKYIQNVIIDNIKKRKRYAIEYFNSILAIG